MLHFLMKQHSEGGQAGSMDVVKVYLRCGRSHLHSPYQAKDQGGEGYPYICHPTAYECQEEADAGRTRCMSWE